MAIPQSSIIQHYTIDLSSNNNFVHIPVPQGDGQNTRYAELELISSNMPYFDMLKLEGIDTFKILIMGSKPDGTQIVNDCELSEEGYVLVPITFQMTIVPGKGEYQVVIIDKNRNSQIKSFPLYLIVVEATFDIDTIVSSNEFALFTKNVAIADDLIANQKRLIQKQTEQTDTWDNTYEPAIKQATEDANTATSNANDKIQEMTEFKSDLENAETERVNSENERKAAEIKRNEEELKRAENENARTENEEIRKTNEATRVKNEQTRVQQENDRVTAETGRDDAETVREEHENTRISQEAERVEAENQRKQNETTRQAQEGDRQANTAEAITNAESATDRANTAAERAEKIYNDIQNAIGIDDTQETTTTAWSSSHTKEYVDQSIESSLVRKISTITIEPNEWVNNKIYIVSDLIEDGSVIDIYYSPSSFDDVADMDIRCSSAVGHICLECLHKARKSIVIDSIVIRNNYVPVEATKSGTV